MKLAGWANFPVVDCRLVKARERADLMGVDRFPSLIARGNGRSYGDAALNPDATVSMLGFNRILSFDPQVGRVICEAGVLLSDLLEVFVPRGWFPPVTPGTKQVTIGGMVAADVHGKNHHVAGSFGRYVEALELMLADASVVRCSLRESEDLFQATIGGMGLTGIILSVTFRMIPIETAYIRQQTVRARDLEEVMAQFEEFYSWTYSVAWIDCLAAGAQTGRSILYLGEHATVAELAQESRDDPLRPPRRRLKRVPFFLPSVTLNRLTVRAFNELYYRRAVARDRTIVVDFDRFFYPLDAVLAWNRIYGRSGFTQYQCVFPKEASRDGLRVVLGRIAAASTGSFLAVLKLFGRQDGILSFPMEGYTLAIDFPVNPGTLSLLTELDAVVADHGGRLYLAKDARMRAELLARGYPELPRFRQIRRCAGAQGRFESVMSRRLEL